MQWDSSPNAGFCPPGTEPWLPLPADYQQINVTVSRLPSTRLDMEARGLPSVVRASVHYYNSEVEIDRFCATLATNRCERLLSLSTQRINYFPYVFSKLLRLFRMVKLPSGLAVALM